ncbi:MAG: hypothetical protein ACRELY_22800 [Polyangiaceae bacterium]
MSALFASPLLVGYLAGFFAAASTSVGALGLLMIACLSGAHWISPFRNRAEVVASACPSFLVAFIPIAWHVRAQSGLVARSYAYLIVWSLLWIAWRKPSITRVASAVGVPVLILTVSFAGFDWMMALTPHWVSDAFGLYVVTGAFAGGVGLLGLLAGVVRNAGNSAESAISPESSLALGSVLLTGVILWAYIAFCQFLIIWIGDLPSEIPFYADRSAGAWKWLLFVAVISQFVFPFILLLSHELKRHPMRVALVGGIALMGHFLDVAWIALPAAGPSLSVTALAVAFAVFVVFVVYCTRPHEAA